MFCSSSHDCGGLEYSVVARVEMSSPVASFKTCEAHFLFRRRDGELQRIGELIAGVQLDAIFPQRPTLVRTRKYECTRGRRPIGGHPCIIHFITWRRNFADIFCYPNEVDC